MKLYRIVSPTYVAGLVIHPKTQRCTEAAPILHWMRGKSYATILGYCQYKGFQLEEIKEKQK